MSVERALADLNKLRHEVTRLQTQLSATQARVTKLEHYVEMARAYEADQEELTHSRQSGSNLVAGAIEIIKERGTRQATRALVGELEKRGYQIGGQNKVTNLSGALSRSKDLISSRTEGWGLKEWEDGSAPQPTAEIPAKPLPWDTIEAEALESDPSEDEEIPF